MNRFINFFMKIDRFLLRRVFMPIAHYIDWRFHINQYDQAAMVLSAGLAMNFARSFQSLLRVPWIGAVACFGSVMLIFVYAFHLKMLNIASQKYEKHPDQISWEQAFFIQSYNTPLRLTMITLGWFMVPQPLSNIFETVTNLWMLVIGCALYIAGGLPPTHKRREKKVWAWPSLRMATTPT